MDDVVLLLSLQLSYLIIYTKFEKNKIQILLIIISLYKKWKKKKNVWFLWLWKDN